MQLTLPQFAAATGGAPPQPVPQAQGDRQREEACCSRAAQCEREWRWSCLGTATNPASVRVTGPLLLQRQSPKIPLAVFDLATDPDSFRPPLQRPERSERPAVTQQQIDQPASSSPPRLALLTSICSRHASIWRARRLLSGTDRGVLIAASYVAQPAAARPPRSASLFQSPMNHRRQS